MKLFPSYFIIKHEGHKGLHKGTQRNFRETEYQDLLALFKHQSYLLIKMAFLKYNLHSRYLSGSIINYEYRE
jgi:hypothetical protein